MTKTSSKPNNHQHCTFPIHEFNTNLKISLLMETLNYNDTLLMKYSVAILFNLSLRTIVLNSRD